MNVLDQDEHNLHEFLSLSLRDTIAIKEPLEPVDEYGED